jgi:hypothetical protein
MQLGLSAKNDLLVGINTKTHVIVPTQGVPKFRSLRSGYFRFSVLLYAEHVILLIPD